MSIEHEGLYEKIKVFVAEDECEYEWGNVTPKPIYKPHETANSECFWVVSNERSGQAGITVFENNTNKVLSVLNIEDAYIPVVQLNGKLGICAPKPSEGARHPHGIAIDYKRSLVYQVIEHSGLQWIADRSGFIPATSSDTESGLLVVYDIKCPKNPCLLYGYLLGHGAEEVAINLNNGKVYVGNHEPSPTNVPCFVSVIKTESRRPYGFIDLPDGDCVQGLDVDHNLNTVNGTTHIGQKMYTFNSETDTIEYSVDIRAPFEAYIGRLPQFKQFEIPEGWVLHMHDLATDSTRHLAYQTIHTISGIVEEEEDEEESEEDTKKDGELETDEGSETGGEDPEEFTGRWIAVVNTNPNSHFFKKVKIIDLSNGQSVPEFPTHQDAIATGLPYNELFIHAHFIEVDPINCTVLVSGEHTGNLGVVKPDSCRLVQAISIATGIIGCTPEESPEPHVHGVSVDKKGTVYVSDEGENCFYESITILRYFECD